MTSVTRTRAARPPTPPELPPPPDQDTLLGDLLRQSGRGIVPIRKTFVQQGHGKSTQPGSLAKFVKAHDERGLEAYLLVHALASGGDYSCEYPAAVWARALGLDATATDESARGAVSKIMKRLEDRGLVSRTRVRRRLSVTLLNENGRGEEYGHPRLSGDRWLRLPHAYWREGYFRSLSLPAKVMLLVALSLPDGFYLPSEYAPAWYGVSPDTAERGLRELRMRRILRPDVEWKPNNRSDKFYTERWTYTLIGAFSKSAQDAEARRGRRASSAETDTEVITEE